MLSHDEARDLLVGHGVQSLAAIEDMYRYAQLYKAAKQRYADACVPIHEHYDEIVAYCDPSEQEELAREAATLAGIDWHGPALAGVRAAFVKARGEYIEERLAEQAENADWN